MSSKTHSIISYTPPSERSLEAMEIALVKHELTLKRLQKDDPKGFNQYEALWALPKFQKDKLLNNWVTGQKQW